MSGIAALPPIPAYKFVSAHETADVAQFEKTDAQTKADIAYFQKVAPALSTPQKLLGNYRALSVVLNAFGMSSTINQTALLKQFMTQSPTASTSTATKIGNPVYLRFAKAMAQFNPPPFSTQSGINAVISAVGTNNFEAAQDKLSPGIGAALYFKRNIGSVTSVVQLMSDPTLLTVAEGATNMPQQFGTLDYDQQVRLLSAKLNIKDFSKAGAVDAFVTKYLAINEASSSNVADPSGALAVLQGSGSSGSVLGSLFPQSGSADPSSILSLFA